MTVFNWMEPILASCVCWLVLVCSIVSHPSPRIAWLNQVRFLRVHVGSIVAPPTPYTHTGTANKIHRPTIQMHVVLIYKYIKIYEWLSIYMYIIYMRLHIWLAKRAKRETAKGTLSAALAGCDRPTRSVHTFAQSQRNCAEITIITYFVVCHESWSAYKILNVRSGVVPYSLLVFAAGRCFF